MARRAEISSPGLVIEAEQAGYARAYPPGCIVLTSGMHAGIEQRCALRVLDQIRRDRQLRFSLSALHQTTEIAGQPAAGHRIELDAHDHIPSQTQRNVKKFGRARGPADRGSFGCSACG
jgi:hypothetical protein